MVITAGVGGGRWAARSMPGRGGRVCLLFAAGASRAVRLDSPDHASKPTRSLARYRRPLMEAQCTALTFLGVCVGHVPTRALSWLCRGPLSLALLWQASGSPIGNLQPLSNATAVKFGFVVHRPTYHRTAHAAEPPHGRASTVRAWLSCTDCGRTVTPRRLPVETPNWQ